MVKIYWVDESVCCWVDGPKERENKCQRVTVQLHHFTVSSYGERADMHSANSAHASRVT